MLEADPMAGIAVFVAVARTGSFTQAAAQQRLTKSAVSKAIVRLEARVGCRLIHRTTRQVRLTPEGEAYFLACATAIEQVSAVEAALSTESRVLSGRIHIDMPASFGRRIVLPILAEIARANPALSLHLTFSDAMSNLLQDGLDLAIRFGPLPDTSHLVARQLARQRRIICAAPSYLDARGVPTTTTDLRRHCCIVGTSKGPPMTWVVLVGGKEKRITPPSTHQLSDGEALVSAAVAGLGLTQLPAFMVREEIASGKLVAVLDDHASGDIVISALWPRQAQLSPKVRHIVDQLVAHAAAGRLS